MRRPVGRPGLFHLRELCEEAQRDHVGGGVGRGGDEEPGARRVDQRLHDHLNEYERLAGARRAV